MLLVLMGVPTPTLSQTIPITSTDQARATQWIEHGAKAGQPWAQAMLAALYESGTGVPQDLEKAVHWYQKAAEAGDTAAQYALGDMYYRGRGVPQDSVQALDWLRQATDQGYDPARTLMGTLIALGEGTEADPKAALGLWKKAAKAGNSDAMFNLGAAYLSGRGTDVKPGTAARWFSRAAYGFAAESRIPEAQHTLSLLRQADPDHREIQGISELLPPAAELEAPEMAVAPVAPDKAVGSADSETPESPAP